MKHYIRTKDRKIFTDKGKLWKYLCGGFFDNEKYDELMKENITAESDNILDLVDAGDLVEIDYGIETCTEKVCQPDRVRKCNVVAIYTKQSNDYILVARKNDNGGWALV